MSSLNLPGGLTITQDGRVAKLDQLDAAAFTNPAFANSIDDVLAWLANLSVGSNSPGGVVPTTDSIVSVLGTLAAGGLVRGGTSVVPVVRPSAAEAVSLGVIQNAWANMAAFVEVVAAASLTSHALTAIHWFMDTGSTGGPGKIEFDVAVGGAGAEVVIGTYQVVYQGKTDAGFLFQPPIVINPPLIITANARVSMRARAGTMAGLTPNVCLDFIPRPM